MSLLKIKYPKFFFFLLTILIAYIMFSNRNFLPFHNFLLSSGYIGIFLAGILFVYGFTAAPAPAILLIFGKEYNILLAGFIAGFGALFGDLLIFNFIKHMRSLLNAPSKAEKVRKPAVNPVVAIVFANLFMINNYISK